MPTLHVLQQLSVIMFQGKLGLHAYTLNDDDVYDAWCEYMNSAGGLRMQKMTGTESSVS